MRKGIHPEYIPAKIMCACGNVIETRATKPVIKIEICSDCHPFFTGKQKLVDTAGRVERFLKKYAKVEAAGSSKKQVKETPQKSAAPAIPKASTKTASKTTEKKATSSKSAKKS